MSARVDLWVGALVLFPEGPRTIVEVSPMGYATRDITGAITQVPWIEVQPARSIIAGRVDAVAESLTFVLSGLSESALQEALDKQEVILTLKTGYARGYAALARPGEPYTIFDPANRASDSRKCAAMAEILGREAAQDRRLQRAQEDGRNSARSRVGAVSARQLMNWLGDYNQDVNGGLLAMVDGRRVRRHTQFATLDPEVRRVADSVASATGSRKL